MVTRKDGGPLEAKPLGPGERRRAARTPRTWRDPPVNLDPEPRSVPKVALEFEAPKATRGLDTIRPDLSGGDSPHASAAFLGGINDINSTWHVLVEFRVPLTHLTIADPTNSAVLVSTSDGELRFAVTATDVVAAGCAPLPTFSLTTEDDILGSFASESLAFAPDLPQSVGPSSTTIQLTAILSPSAAERPDLFSTTVHLVSNGITSKEADWTLITVPCDADGGAVFTTSSPPTGLQPITAGESGGSGSRMNASKLVIGSDHPRSGAAHELERRDLRLRGM